MRKVISLFLSLIMVMGVFVSVPVTVNAASVDDLKFKKTEAGTGYIVTDCDMLAQGEIVIPDTYNGLPVTEIYPFAFQDCLNVTSAIIPDSIINIGAEAFRSCSSLNSIEVDSDNLNYTSKDGVLFDNKKTIIIQYPIGKTVTTYEIPNHIEVQAFMSCTNLTAIIIPKNQKAVPLSSKRGETTKNQFAMLNA